eukprot:6212563-Pleurochrysis_carterae.AAC.3
MPRARAPLSLRERGRWAPRSEGVTARRHSFPCHSGGPSIAVCRAAMLVGLGCAGTASRAGHALPKVCDNCCQPANFNCNPLVVSVQTQGMVGGGSKYLRGRPLPSPCCVASEWRVTPLDGRNVPIRM